MKKKIFIFFFLFIFNNSSIASMKDDIIFNLKNTSNLTFNFIQNINEKEEDGECTISYPKKINCKYNTLNKKIMVSNGKSLVIKNLVNNQYYRYPLNRTPLNFILDKDYLISQLIKLEGRVIDKRYLNFTLINENNKINVFFSKKTLDLVGWQTEDVYQNLVITFISQIKINQEIDQNIFDLPKPN